MLQKTTPSPCLAMPTPTLAARSTRYLLGAAVLAAAAYIAWQWWPTPQSLANVAGGNGRLEATPIDIATRAGGRIADVLVKEGDEVSAGQVLVRMDSATLLAELSRAQASVRQAEQARTTAQALVAQRQQAIQTATAVIRQREADLALARRQWERTRDLVDQGFLPPQKRDEAQAQLQGARAALAVAQSLVAEARTGLRAAEAQITEAEAAIDTAHAGVQRVEADLADMELKAPRAGRIQVRAAQPGEVIGAGGRVLSMVDLSDVHMSFFLPEAAAGRLAIGAPARIVLDAAPQYVVPATISFVASVAQFTPKTVETSSERQKLVFKVRAQVPPDLLQRYRHHVKTGLPGMAYVLIDPTQPWPQRLEVALPAEPQGATQRAQQ